MCKSEGVQLDQRMQFQEGPGPSRWSGRRIWCVRLNNRNTIAYEYCYFFSIFDFIKEVLCMYMQVPI